MLVIRKIFYFYFGRFALKHDQRHNYRFLDGKITSTKLFQVRVSQVSIFLSDAYHLSYTEVFLSTYNILSNKIRAIFSIITDRQRVESYNLNSFFEADQESGLEILRGLASETNCLMNLSRRYLIKHYLLVELLGNIDTKRQKPT